MKKDKDRKVLLKLQRKNKAILNLILMLIIGLNKNLKLLWKEIVYADFDFTINSEYEDKQYKAEIDFKSLTGNCGISGNNVIWQLKLNKNNTYSLYISGKGKMKDHDFNKEDSLTNLLKKQNKNISKIIIEKGITYIGNYIFYGNESIKELAIKSKTTIGKYAFYKCCRLEKIKIPEVTEIGNNAFQGCNLLKETEMPKTQKIGSYAFQGCNSLNKIYIPQIKELGNYSFANCLELEEIILSENIEIKDEYFDGSKNTLKVKTIANKLLYEKKESKDKLISNKKNSKQPNNKVNDVFIYGYCGATKRDKILYRLIINEKCGYYTLIISGKGNMANYNCESKIPWHEYLNKITKVIVKDEVKNIGDGAFLGCLNLKEVKMPQVEIIGRNSFYICKSLEKVTMKNIKIIKDKAFIGNESLKEIEIPNVKEIGIKSFLECQSLNKIDMPKVKIVKDRGFAYCNSLKEVYMPDIQEIGDFCFFKCDNLEKVEMPTIKNIKNSAFSLCFALKNVTIPKDVILGSNVFDGCNLLRVTRL